MNNVQNSLKHNEDWSPWDNLVNQDIDVGYGIIILNTPINFSFNPNFIINLWNKGKNLMILNDCNVIWCFFNSSNLLAVHFFIRMLQHAL